MGYVIRMPQLGMSMEEGAVVEWRFDEGASVDEGQVVAIVESEKTSAEVEARESGRLGRIVADEGATVEPGAPIGAIVGPGEDVAEYADQLDAAGTGDTSSAPGTDRDKADTAASAAASAGADPDAASAPSTSVKATPGARRRADEAGIDVARVDGTGPEGVVTGDDVERAIETSRSDERVRATPGAKRVAEERGVELSEVDGTGPQGVVTEADVRERTSESERPDQEPAIRSVAETRRLSNAQRTVSDRLGRSYRDAVHVTLHRSFDTATVESVIDAAVEAGLDGSLTDVLIRAAAAALASHPEFNASFEDGEHRLYEEVNVGVAVDLDDGLITPVVPDVGSKGVEAVHRERVALAERVESGEFTMDDLAGGTFTISNLGPYGVDHFDPVINPPEIAILGVGRVRDDGTMALSLSFDHRVVNGADAARFLADLVDVLTDETALAGLYAGDVLVPGGGSPRAVSVETPSSYAGTYTTDFGTVRFDEPEDVGGTGAAPSPVDHLLGSLGACLSLSVRAMALRDGVPVGTIAADVTGAPDEGPLASVDVTLSIDTDAEDDAVDAVVTKAERACYVARSLSDDLDVTVDWQRR